MGLIGWHLIIHEKENNQDLKFKRKQVLIFSFPQNMYLNSYPEKKLSELDKSINRTNVSNFVSLPSKAKILEAIEVLAILIMLIFHPKLKEGVEFIHLKHP